MTTTTPDTIAAALSIGVAVVIAALVRFQFVASACLITLTGLGIFYKSASVLTVVAWFATLTMLLAYGHRLLYERPGNDGDPGRGHPPKGGRGTSHPGSPPRGSQPPQNGKVPDADPLKGTLGIDISPVGRSIVRRASVILLLIQLIIILVFVVQHMGALREVVFRYWPYFIATGTAFFFWLLLLWGVWRIRSGGSRFRPSA